MLTTNYELTEEDKEICNSILQVLDESLILSLVQGKYSDCLS